MEKRWVEKRCQEPFLTIRSRLGRLLTWENLKTVPDTFVSPVLGDEPETRPFTLPEGMKPAPRNVLVRHPDFEIPKPCSTSIVGFFATWAAVGVLIATFYGILNL